MTELTNPASPAYGMTLDWIGRVSNGSAAAVGNRWFVTTAHLDVIVGSEIELSGGSVHNVTEIHNAPQFDELNRPDLRVVKVAEELADWYDVYEGAPALNESVVMAGTGYDGTVNELDSTFEWSTGTERTWRWGTNTVSRCLWVPSGPYSSLCVQMDFDYGATAYEAGWSSGDSGGGAFIREDGQWKLAGVASYVCMLGGGSSPPYNTSSAVLLGAYAEWIWSIVPTGDLNGDSVVGVDDVDLLWGQVRYPSGGGSSGALYDLDSDGAVDAADVDFLIRRILNTEYGDFNLDGLIDTTDLTILGTNYGGVDVGWAGGDVNGDGVVDTTDLTVMATYFGFVAEDHIVPEPGSAALLLLGVSALLRRRRGT